MISHALFFYGATVSSHAQAEAKRLGTELKVRAAGQSEPWQAWAIKFCSSGCTNSQICQQGRG